MQIFLSCAVPASSLKKSFFIWVRGFCNASLATHRLQRIACNASLATHRLRCFACVASNHIWMLYRWPWLCMFQRIWRAGRRAGASIAYSSRLRSSFVGKRPANLANRTACLLAQWNSYGGSWKWVTILPILVGIVNVQLLFAIGFFIPSYVHQQLHSLDCQNFIHTTI